eukprot:346160-Prymnesium_polylepis.1
MARRGSSSRRAPPAAPCATTIGPVLSGSGGETGRGVGAGAGVGGTSAAGAGAAAKSCSRVG